MDLTASQKIVSDLLDTKIPQRKFFFIKYGPPGSGKASLNRQAIETFHIDADTLVDVDVDGLMAQIPAFTKKLSQINEQYSKPCPCKKEKLSALYAENRQLGDKLSDLLLNTALL